MSYSDLMKMPTYERKYFIHKLSEEFSKRQEEYEKAKNRR